MNKTFLIALSISSLFFYQCTKKKCAGISPSLSDEDKKSLSQLMVGDSLIFKNEADKYKVFHVVDRSFLKIYDTGGGKTLRPKCSDYDTDNGQILYSSVKGSVMRDSIFLSLGIIRGSSGNLYTYLSVRDSPFDLGFKFYDPTPDNAPSYLKTPMSKEIGLYEVNGKTYSEVQFYDRDTTGFNLKNNERAIHKMYYSKNAGLIKYEYTDKEVWSRQIK